MRDAVFDSSTLILAARAGILSHLFNMFTKIIIPDGVYNEVVIAGKQKLREDALIVEQEIKNNKIEVISVKKRDAVTKLLEEFNLQRGEAEAIVICLEHRALFLGTDDKEAIKVCRVYKIPFITALALTVKLAKERYILPTEAKLIMMKLEKVGYYSNQIVADAKKECDLNGNRS
ncbi:hypothetical protein COX84_00625 [Candidatus Micrarchaeota archaeon CG_4_10_14_0_2_um_filter_49_7]|nr:MAG: hypothetical protein COX84_00625 [Candidatus Micrarchaeota archaeon CG_4_10_14_0_2_um_filter_49_7]HII54245.1 hypothetical protein [Candidatus Micrarchaeota archaeon]